MEIFIKYYHGHMPFSISVYLLGESVKIISAQDDVDYVMATKKLKFFRKKTGLIPIYTFWVFLNLLSAA